MLLQHPRTMSIKIQDANRFANQKAIHCIIPEAFQAIANWGCRKASFETYWEYLLRRNGPRQPWFRGDRLRLQETTCTDFDVTLLAKLIPEVCENLEPRNSDAWRVKDDTRIESILTQLKNIRNMICHYPRNTNCDYSTEIDGLCVKALRLSGVLYNIPLAEVQQKIDRITSITQDIRDSILLHGSEIVKRSSFISDCMNEMREQMKPELTMPLTKEKVPLTSVFHPCYLLIEKTGNVLSEDDEDNAQVSVPCSQLFQNLRGNVCIEGEPGSGKSTLTRRMEHDFVFRDEPEYFTGIRQFDLLLSMSCRNNQIMSCAELLKQNFPRTLQGLNAELVVFALRSMNVLTVVDGIDELNETSNHLLNQLIDTFGVYRKPTLLFTSRPGSTQTLKDTLSMRGLNYLVASIQTISNEEEQLEFLRRYAKSIPRIATRHLVEQFSMLNSEVFRSPFALLIYLQIYLRSPLAAEKITSELDVMQAIMDLSQESINSYLTNSGHIVRLDKLIKDLGDMALQSLSQSKSTVDSAAIVKLYYETLGHGDVSYDQLVSFLSVQHPNHESFIFTHKTFMEWMAATAITFTLESNPHRSIMSIISEIINESSGETIAGSSLTTSGGSSGTTTAIAGSHVTTPANNSEAAANHRVPSAGRSSAISTNFIGGASNERFYLPNHVMASQFQNVFTFVVMKLVNDGNIEILRRSLDEICDALVEEGVEFSYWHQLALRCPTSEDVAEKVALAAKRVAEGSDYPQGRRWEIHTEEQIAAVTRMLRHHQPPQLALHPVLPETLLNRRLRDLLNTVRDCHSGNLSLDLQHSFDVFSPADELLGLLDPARCRIVWFRGCLGGSNQAWQALVQGAMKATLPKLFISLAEPDKHQLGLLKKPVEMDVRTRLSVGYGDLSPRPLPTSPNHPPLLTIIGTKETGTTGVISLVTYLAPSDRKFHVVALKTWGDEANLKKVVDDLKEAGVTTSHSYDPRWNEVGCGRDRKCVVCRTDHETGQRCVRIWV